MTLNNISWWKHDSNYIGEDYSDCYVILTKHRDSSLIVESNFESVRRDIEFYYPESTIVVRLNHWAVGWIEMLLIHSSQTEALAEADQIVYKLDNIYPIYDEDDYTSRVWDTANQIWDNAPEWEREEICEAIGVSLTEDSDAPEGAIDYIIERWGL